MTVLSFLKQRRQRKQEMAKIKEQVLLMQKEIGDNADIIALLKKATRTKDEPTIADRVDEVDKLLGDHADAADSVDPTEPFTIKPTFGATQTKEEKQAAVEDKAESEEPKKKERPKDAFDFLAINYLERDTINALGMYNDKTEGYLDKYWGIEPEIPLVLIVTGTPEQITKHIQVLKNEYGFRGWTAGSSVSQSYMRGEGIKYICDLDNLPIGDIQSFMKPCPLNMLMGHLEDNNLIHFDGYLQRKKQAVYDDIIVNPRAESIEDVDLILEKVHSLMPDYRGEEFWHTVADKQVSISYMPKDISPNSSKEYSILTGVMCANLACEGLSKHICKEISTQGSNARQRLPRIDYLIQIRYNYTLIPETPKRDARIATGDWHLLDRMLCSTDRFPTQLMVYLPDDDSPIYQHIKRSSLEEYFYCLPRKLQNSSFFITFAPHDLSQIKEAYKDLNLAELRIRKISLCDGTPIEATEIEVKLPTQQVVLLTLPDFSNLDYI